MKRKTKNILSIVLIVLLCVSVVYTKHLSKNNASDNSNMEVLDHKTSPNNTNSGENNEPPAKPDSSNSGESNEPPAKPDDSNTQGGMEDNNQPPEIPSGENNQQGMENNQMSKPSEETKDNKYEIIIIIEIILLSVIIIYLIMSNFNKKSFKETLENKDKVAILLLSTIVLTLALNVLQEKLPNTNKTVENNNSNNKNTNISYTSSNEITASKTITEGEYSSTTADENALLITGSLTADISNVTVTKTGDSEGGDNTSFYGTNSAIIAKDGATVTLKNITVETNATGANGVFSYGGSATTSNTTSDGTTVNISDSTIKTTKDNSGGIMTTGGGIMNASNLTIETSGISSAAIRSDRGGGTVNVDGGTYKTTNQGSPTIYSTADITVKNATLTATASEGIVIEGKNKVSIENVNLTDTNNKLNGKSTTYKNIFLYQSMSGDADEGESEFTAKDSTIVTNVGDTIYVTNTKAKIELTNNKFINNDASGNFLRIKSDSWGDSGSNGGEVDLTMSNQTVNGNIVVDSISTLKITMNNNSSYEGELNKDNTAKSLDLQLDKTSKIKLTSDCYVTSLENEDTTNSNIDFNGYKLYVNGTAIN